MWVALWKIRASGDNSSSVPPQATGPFSWDQRLQRRAAGQLLCAETQAGFGNCGVGTRFGLDAFSPFRP
jgi:hypothetical protein